MASDLAMVFGVFTGFTWSRSSSTMSTIGAQPAACAPWMRGLRAGADSRPSFSSSPNALPILVTSEPPAIGTTTCAGSRQPSCSAIS